MKKLIIISVVIVIVTGIALFFWKKGEPNNENNQIVSGQEGSLETGAFEKGNPFEVDVNPTNAYQNPFGQ